MSRFRAGQRCKIVGPIYGWEVYKREYMGRTIRLRREFTYSDSYPRWYFVADPPITNSHDNAAYNNGYLWIHETSLRPTGFGAWVSSVEERWPREHV